MVNRWNDVIKDYNNRMCKPDLLCNRMQKHDSFTCIFRFIGPAPGWESEPRQWICQLTFVLPSLRQVSNVWSTDRQEIDGQDHLLEQIRRTSIHGRKFDMIKSIIIKTPFALNGRNSHKIELIQFIKFLIYFKHLELSRQRHKIAWRHER